MIVKILATFFFFTILITYLSFLKWININVLEIALFSFIQFFIAVGSFTLFLYLSNKTTKNKRLNLENNERKEITIFICAFIFSIFILPYSLKYINKSFSSTIIDKKEYTIIEKEILPIRFNNENSLLLKDKNNKIFTFSSSSNTLYKVNDKIKLDIKKGFLGFDYLEEPSK